jgi:16S rRNA (guanine966-N2)-methyltransferase
VFNLVGPAVRGKCVIDLFAGTGALALEALSRGAAQAILVEQHLPTAATISGNIDLLGVESRCRLVKGDVFVWHKRGPDLGTVPWLVFCSPPYDFYVERRDKMLSLLGGLIARAPADSIFVVESDDRFDFGQLPQPESWDVRAYLPALVGINRKVTNS